MGKVHSLDTVNMHPDARTLLPVLTEHLSFKPVSLAANIVCESRAGPSCFLI